MQMSCAPNEASCIPGGSAAVCTDLCLEMRRGLGPEEVDRRLAMTNGAEGAVQRVSGFYLLDVYQRNLHQQLGYSSIYFYAETRLGMQRSTSRTCFAAV